jgi:hypothetical protein
MNTHLGAGRPEAVHTLQAVIRKRADHEKAPIPDMFLSTLPLARLGKRIAIRDRDVAAIEGHRDETVVPTR